MLMEYLDGGYLHMKNQNETDIHEDIKEAIRYTKYDNMRNGEYRANRLNQKKSK